MLQISNLSLKMQNETIMLITLYEQCCKILDNFLIRLLMPEGIFGLDVLYPFY